MEENTKNDLQKIIDISKKIMEESFNNCEINYDERSRKNYPFFFSISQEKFIFYIKKDHKRKPFEIF